MVDVERLMEEHPLAVVLRRCGIAVPDPAPGVCDEWRGHCPLPSHPAPADPGRHKPSLAVHISGRMAGRWHCFACQTGGDTIAFVQAYAQVGFRDAVKLIVAEGHLPRGADPHLHLRPATPTPAGNLMWPTTPGSDREAPEPARTTTPQLLAAMREAWCYYSLDGLARTARRYLALRDIDSFALELREGRPLAGHTPRSKTGLVVHLRKRGFGDDELVDAGLASRHPDGRVEDFFTHRLVLPVRDSHDQVLGLIGRDVLGADRAKYLNTATTAIYDKSRQLYRPTRPSHRPASNLVVVEGVLDALALDAYAASAGVDLTAVSPSGVALTAAHRASIYTQSARPPVLCADGDPAGRQATARWVLDMTVEGRESVAVTLPHPYDPADWLAESGVAGLTTFIRAGCLEASNGDVQPTHVGRFLAERIAERQDQLCESLSALGALGARLHDGSARRRYAEQAGRGLAAAGLGPDGWLERAIARRMVVRSRDLDCSARIATPVTVMGP
jgi:DNA primase catalytic core